MHRTLTYEDESRLIVVLAFCCTVPTDGPRRIGAAEASRRRVNSERGRSGKACRAMDSCIAICLAVRLRSALFRLKKTNNRWSTE